MAGHLKLSWKKQLLFFFLTTVSVVIVVVLNVLPSPEKQIFSASGSKLFKVLEGNIYAPDKADVGLHNENGRIIFVPSTKSDHVATRFFDIEAKPNKAELLVSLKSMELFSGSMLPKLKIQDGDFNNIFQQQLENTVDEEILLEITLPANTKKFRLYFTGVLGKTVVLPGDITIRSASLNKKETSIQQSNSLPFLFHGGLLPWLLLIFTWSGFIYFKSIKKTTVEPAPNVTEQGPSKEETSSEDSPALPKRSRWYFKWIVIAISLLFAMVAAELVCRIFTQSKHGTMSVPDLYEKERNNTFAARAQSSYERSLFPHPYLAFVHNEEHSKGVNSQGFLGGRAFPLKKDESEFRILITGGSVAANFAQLYEEGDRALEELLNEQYDFGGRKVVVYNGADGAWKQPQQFITLSLFGEVFDAVISLDGFNEHYMLLDNSTQRLEMPAPNFETINPLVSTGGWNKLSTGLVKDSLDRKFANHWLFSNSSFAYYLGKPLRESLKDFAYLPEQTGANRKTTVQTMFALPSDWSPPQRIAFNIEQYKKYTRLMLVVAKHWNLKTAFFVQPCPAISKTLTETEKGVVGDLDYRDHYLHMTEELLRLQEENVPIYSLLDVFKDRPETIYSDAIHFVWNRKGSGSHANEIVAKRMVELIATDWNLKRKQ